MCGIVYGKRKDGKPIAKSILKRYRNQSTRGKQGFGYVAVENNKVVAFKRFVTEAEVEKELLKETASEILFHHRFPTSTPNMEDLNHPILIENAGFHHKYYFIHNGVISNDDELKAKHDKLGFQYSTVLKKIKIERTKNFEHEDITEVFNDSESLGFEVALFLEGLQDKIEAIGSIAFVCLQTDLEDNVINLFYGRNSGNPLVIERDKFDKKNAGKSDIFFLKSEGGGYKLEENQIVKVEATTGEVEIIYEPVGKVYKYQSTTASEYWKQYDKKKEEERNQKKFGFNTTPDSNFERDDKDYEQEDDVPSNLSIVGVLAEELEDKLSQLFEEEADLLEQIKELRHNIGKENDHEVRFEYELEIQECQDDLVQIRRQISRLEDEFDSLYSLDTESELEAEVREKLDEKRVIYL